MKLITFLACIMMSLSIWSFTALAQTVNQEAAGSNPPSQDSFPQATNCLTCKKNMEDSKGCQTGYNPSDCKTMYDGKPNDKAPAPSSSGTIVH